LLAVTNALLQVTRLAYDAKGNLTTKGSERTEAREGVVLCECVIAPNVLSIRC
jgi:YD repeat-containing protein